jgi:phosphatidylglycerol:prolipoprotein diacylglycerol transferase
MPLALFVNGYWVDQLSPFLIQFTDNFGIRYYGLGYMLGFLAAAWLLHRYARAGRSQLPPEKIADLMVALVFGVLIGGRLGYFLLYQPRALIESPLDLLRVWDGGMASHGGFVGVTVALWWFARRAGLSFFHLADLAASATPVGLFLVRIANFINGELWGKITDVRWAVIFPKSAEPGTPLHLIAPRHPSQLYEAALEGVLLLALMQWRFWRSDVVRREPGRLSGEFLIAYALVRIVGELFREPDFGISLIFGLSRGTFYSVFMILAGLALIVRARRVRAP